MVCITKGAKASLDKVLAENAEVEEGILSPSSMLPPIVADSSLDLQKPHNPGRLGPLNHEK